FGQFDFCDPPLSVRVGVHKFALSFQGGVDFDDFAWNGRIKVADGFHRFDGSETAALLQHSAGFGQIEVNDVAEFALRVVGNADGGDIAFQFQPFVRGCVQPVSWDVQIQNPP